MASKQTKMVMGEFSWMLIELAWCPGADIESIIDGNSHC